MIKQTVGLLSDTHGWLDPLLVDIFNEHKVVRIFHAGDIGRESILEELKEVAPVTAVKGNIDGGDLRYLPVNNIESVAERRIALTHIAGSPKYPERRVIALIEQENPDIIVVGHSHIPVVGRVNGTMWVNPGAAGRQGIHAERFAALLHLQDDGEVKMDRIFLGSRW